MKPASRSRSRSRSLPSWSRRSGRYAGPAACVASRRADLRGLRGIAVPVLEGALDRSLQLATSMDARGYGRRSDTGRLRRGLPRVPPWPASSWLPSGYTESPTLVRSSGWACRSWRLPRCCVLLGSPPGVADCSDRATGRITGVGRNGLSSVRAWWRSVRWRSHMPSRFPAWWCRSSRWPCLRCHSSPSPASWWPPSRHSWCRHDVLYLRRHAEELEAMVAA